MKISIIIINYKGKRFFNKLINSLKEQTLLADEIIIIDNECKSELSEQYFKTKFNIRYYVNKSNIGFAKAVNMGVINASNEYIVIMNNDIYLENDFLKYIELYFKQFNNTILCPLVLDYKGEFIDSAGDIIDKYIKPHKRFSGVHIKNIELRDEYVSSCSMSVCAIKKNDFINIGKLREDFFMYFEDSEFCIRALKKGYKILFSPKLKAYHYISGSTKLKYNNIYSSQKVFNEAKNRVLLSKHFINSNFINILYFIKGTIDSFLFHLIKSHFAIDFINGTLSGVMKLRRKINV